MRGRARSGLREVGLAILAVLATGIVACGTPSAPNATASSTPAKTWSPLPSEAPTTSLGASASPSPLTLGVIVTEGRGTDQPNTYFVAIIGNDGSVRAGVRATEPSLFTGVPPWVSVAGLSVFYIDGDSKLMRLAVDGTRTLIATLPGSPSARVMAAVDPVSGRIAYGVVAAGSTASRLWLENADGTQPRALPGNGLPIAWHEGSIVIAPAAGYVQNRGESNPYLARTLELVDPASGAVSDMTAACSGPTDSIDGPLTPAGIACRHFPSTGTPSFVAIGWNGHASQLGSPVQPNSGAVLSLDGASAAIFDGGIVGGSPDLLLCRSGEFVSMHIPADPVGWFDATHLLVNTTPLEGSSRGFEVVDVTTGAVQPLDLGINDGSVSYAPYFATLPWD